MFAKKIFLLPNFYSHMDKLVLNSFVAAYILFYSLMVVHGHISCSQTPYPHVCNHYMSTYKKLSNRDFSSSSSSFPDMALRITMDKAIEAHKLVSSMDLNNFKDKRAMAALDDCLELYKDTVNKINRSMSSKNPNDRLTWLSASMANQQTCQNGFIDFNLPSQAKYLPVMLTNFSNMLSNSLAITKAISLSSTSSSSLSSNKRNGDRRLLSDSFPEWLSAADRRLLLSLETSPNANIVVAQDGSGNYKTVSEGVAAAAKISVSGRVVVHVKAGVYKEHVQINSDNLMIVGDGIDATVVSGSKSNGGGSTTLGSATFAVSGDSFIARDITFENSAGPQQHQAVAVRSGSDHSVFYRCSFKGYQDTLYVYSQRQFYRDCDIYGTVDFIFGDASVVIQNSNIYARSGQQNFVTAQSRSDPNENTGIIIHNSRITASSKTFLGRPWKSYSRVVVMKTDLDGSIDPAGWSAWPGRSDSSTVYYGEYLNSGPGADTRGRVKWPGFHVITSSNEAAKFTVGNFLNGDSWISGTGVPFDAGL